MTIFVSIAAYRDSELVPTIQDCIAKARYPLDLRIVVCWQHDEQEQLGSVSDVRQVEFLEFDWRDSNGPCWARAEIMKVWRGEDYYLQLDSHHRFVRHWDARLAEQLALAPSPKPLLTTYCQDYDLHTGVPLSTAPTRIDFDSFTPDGIPLYRSASVSMDHRSAVSPPMRARFVSAHFLFAAGSFVQEVEYDPALYFHGEEITLAVRAYSCGYDLFHPSEAIVFHRYSRDGRAKHWDDHSDGAPVERPWYERDGLSRLRVTELLRSRPVGRFAFGNCRTVDDYERYAGIDFRARMIQDYVLTGGEPPSPTGSNWVRATRSCQVTMHLERTQLAKVATLGATEWHVALFDDEEAPVHSTVLPQNLVAGILADTSPLILIQVTVESRSVPHSWALTVAGVVSCDVLRGMVEVVVDS
jgi:Glycosyltransferase (GlcNAc)